MKRLVIGVLAHVDAGKTTLSESILFNSGAINKTGRVDNGDAFLDTFELEKKRGITIFSKQAVFEYKDTCVTLLDTPGHVDFSAEMERTLAVLDAAILIVSGPAGVQGHTLTLFKCLSEAQIPTFIFVNKMDQPGTDKEKILSELKSRLSSETIDFTDDSAESFMENIAASNEELLENYLEGNAPSLDDIKELIDERVIFPVFFGSALRNEGVTQFMEGLFKYVTFPQYGEKFGARVFKISHDEDGTRLTHMKITGGSLKNRFVMPSGEKVTGIRVYSGNRYASPTESFAGEIVAVSGLNTTRFGEAIGAEKGLTKVSLEPVMTYKMEIGGGRDVKEVLPKLFELADEQPDLHIRWNEALSELQAESMGDVQLEILKSEIARRYGIDVSFGESSVLYKETITAPAIGIGHFEPLKHYAEVHLLLEPGDPGSGITAYSSCSTDVLEKNWQRLILTHILEKEHVGVLTGSPVTDIKITLISGRSHIKHTEGGDFRQATYRAIRQGLMQAPAVLLEPYYDFTLELPANFLGRAISDIEKMSGTFEITESGAERAVISGNVPVVTMNGYQSELNSYTGGKGSLTLTPSGYDVCHNADEVMESFAYDPESDLDNPSSSVFCSHGTGFIVTWESVPEFKHVEDDIKLTGFEVESNIPTEEEIIAKAKAEAEKRSFIGTDEIDGILERTLYANRKVKKSRFKKEEPVIRKRSFKAPEIKDEYLLIDGYNVLFSWDEAAELLKANIDGAKQKLIDKVCNYAGRIKAHVILVFDAYHVLSHPEEVLKEGSINIVYTKTAQTADSYIERFATDNAKKYLITVATSDRQEQIIIRSQGCRLLSVREFLQDMNTEEAALRRDFEVTNKNEKIFLTDMISKEAKRLLDEIE